MAAIIATLRGLAEAVPFSVVAGVVAIAALLFAFAATLSKLTAEEFAKLSVGDGVLATRVRARLQNAVNREYKRTFRFFIAWTVGGFAATVFSVLAARSDRMLADVTTLSLALGALAISVFGVFTGARAHLRARVSGAQLREEIQSAQWLRRDRERIGASIAEIPKSADAVNGNENLTIHFV